MGVSITIVLTFLSCIILQKLIIESVVGTFVAIKLWINPGKIIGDALTDSLAIADLDIFLEVFVLSSISLNSSCIRPSQSANNVI